MIPPFFPRLFSFLAMDLCSYTCPFFFLVVVLSHRLAPRPFSHSVALLPWPGHSPTPTPRGGTIRAWMTTNNDDVMMMIEYCSSSSYNNTCPPSPLPSIIDQHTTVMHGQVFYAIYSGGLSSTLMTRPSLLLTPAIPLTTSIYNSRYNK